MNGYEKIKKQIAISISIALLTGMLLTPLEGAAASASVIQSGSRIVESIVSTGRAVAGKTANTGASASGGAIHTPVPTPTLTPTPRPAATAKPGEAVLLGQEDSLVYVTIGKKGEFDIDRSVTAAFPSEITSRLMKITYLSYDETVLKVTEDGSYEALNPGEARVAVYGYDEDDDWLFHKNYTVYVTPDMTNVTLSESSLTIYINKSDYYSSPTATVKINSSYTFDEEDDILYDVTSSNEDMDVSASISNNKITIRCSDAGKTTVLLTLFGKEFRIHLKVVYVALSATSLLMVKHTSKQLKVKGYSGKVTWHSSRPSVAAITQKGKIRTKKEGNTVISVKVGTIRLGCILSVTTDRKKKAIRRAQKIASTSTYSQPKRMLKGYYDCSSLVWRAYSKYGYRFGSASYAPTAASQAEYMAQHNKLLKGGFSKGNVENLRIKAGDLLFETGANNGRYKGIYHVEMIAGYEFVGWKNNGKAMVAVKWANRSDGYYGYGAGIVGKM